MNLKKILKKKLGDSYYKYRLKYILTKREHKIIMHPVLPPANTATLSKMK